MELFHQGFVVVGEKLQHTAGRRRVGDWIGRVHDGFTSDVAHACGTKNIGRCRSSLQFAIRHPGLCRALVLLVPADYLPEGTSIHGGAVVRAMVNSDFAGWAVLKLMTTMPGAMAGMMLGTDAAVVRAADPGEKARVQQVLEHLLPISPRIAGMNFDVKTAAIREQYPLAKIACPVLTISAEDDRFGTASRARYIAASVPGGRAIIFPTGGHALVGRYGDALHEITSFLQKEKP